QFYNATSNTWTAGTAIPTGIWMPGAATGIDGRIYVAGGELNSASSSLTTLQIYNPQTKTWSTGANMITGRKQFSLVAAPGGLLYAIGGMIGSTSATSNVEAYNIDRKSTRLNSSHVSISYAVF